MSQFVVDKGQIFIVDKDANGLPMSLVGVAEELNRLANVNKTLLADRHRFRSALRHAQTQGTSAVGAFSAMMKILADALDKDGLPRGFEHEPDGEAMEEILKEVSGE